MIDIAQILGPQTGSGKLCIGAKEVGNVNVSSQSRQTTQYVARISVNVTIYAAFGSA